MEHKKTFTSQLSLTTLALLLGIGLAGCGGGGGDDDKGSPAAGIGSTTGGTVDTGSSTQCTNNSDLEDVWLENRMDCIKVGQQFADRTKNKTGELANRTFNLAVLATDPGMNTVLGNKKYMSFLCVKNAPMLNVRDVGLDSGGIFNISNQDARPSSVGYIGIRAAQADEKTGSYIVDSCDTSKYPVIIDYATGKVDSVNKDALSSVTTEMRYTWQDF